MSLVKVENLTATEIKNKLTEDLTKASTPAWLINAIGREADP